MPLAMRRITDADHEILAETRRARVAAARPGQLAERAAIIATLAVDPAAVKREAAHAVELAKAERDVEVAQGALERARDRVSELWRNEHGRGHRANRNDDDARARLGALSHPVVAFVEQELRNAHLAACAVRPSFTGIEHSETPAEPAPETARRWWHIPAMLQTSQPISTHGAQLSFMEAILEARARVDDLQYADLDDDAVLGRVRQELDALVAFRLPLSLEHIRLGLAELRRKLNPHALELWQIGEDPR